MNKFQYYLTKLAEEAGEIIKAALKTQQFGYKVIGPTGISYDNKQDCHNEINDLLAVIEILNEKHGFEFTPNREAIEAKKKKMREFLNYSIGLGNVDKD